MPIRGPKVKVSRALNLALTPKAARIMEARPFGPGQHGSGRKRSASVYKQQLMEKQRLKFSYDISEAHLKKAYKKAATMEGATGEVLMQLLERRLDAQVIRMGFAKTTSAARQYVAHGHFEVNGTRSFSGSRLIRVGDVITVRTKSQNHPQIKESLENSESPAFVEVDKAKFSGKLISIPSRDEISIPVTEQLVVEYYSR